MARKKKKCPQCPKKTGPQSMSAFNKNASARDGRQSICRECQKKRGKATTKTKAATRTTTVTQRAAARAAKAAQRANKREGPAFVIGRAAIPEPLRREIEVMAWEVLDRHMKRLKAKDRRIVSLYRQAQGVEA